MKKDLSESISKIERIYTEIPNDFALQDVKLFLRKAINEMKDLQSKRNKRNTASQQNVTTYLDFSTAKAALKEIDKLIEIEKKNLDKTNTNAENSNEFLIG